MQKAYPENIDQIENFYNSNLTNAVVEPPSDMWDRVNTAYQKSDDKKGFFKTYRFSILLLLFFIGSIVVYAVFVNKAGEIGNTSAPNESPITKEPTRNVPNQEVIENKPAATQEKNSSAIKNKNTNNIPQEEKNSSINSNDKPAINSTDAIIAPLENKTTADTSRSAAPEIKTEKKKVKFKDKYKEQYQDSTRPLFVPHK